MNICWWVKRWSELHPHKTAIQFENRKITFSELYQRTRQVDYQLQKLGIRKGDRVAVILRNCPEFIEIYLACSRLGAIFVPLNFRLSAPELDYLLSDSRPKLLVIDSNYYNLVKHLRLKMLLVGAGEKTESSNIMHYLSESIDLDEDPTFEDFTSGPTDPEEPHVIMYTSGTSGKPKGAVLSHRKTFFNCLNADIFFKLQFNDIMLVVLPLFHSGGLFIQASPTIYKGATLILHQRFEPTKVFEDIDRCGVTKLLGVPTVYRTLLQNAPQEKGQLSSLKICAIGGEKTNPELVAECTEAGFPLRQVMGQTETSILLWAAEEDAVRKPGSVGRPVLHADVELVDQGGQPVKTGEVGEIVVRGSIMMTEYWRDPTKTAETFRDGWLHTGDLAYRDAEGYYYLVDRVKDMYISGGENVYPAEVEEVLRGHPDIEDVAVVAVPDEKWGETGHAFVIPKNGKELDPADLVSFYNAKLACFKRPKAISFCREFPRTTLGKVRKQGLLKNAAVGEVKQPLDKIEARRKGVTGKHRKRDYRLIQTQKEA